MHDAFVSLQAPRGAMCLACADADLPAASKTRALPFSCLVWAVCVSAVRKRHAIAVTGGVHATHIVLHVTCARNTHCVAQIVLHVTCAPF